MKPVSASKVPLAPACQTTITLLIVLAVVGCKGPQSALDPAGESASQLANLFWWMTGVASLIWLVVIGLAIYAIRINPSRHDVRHSRRFIIGGGTVAPTIILAILLVYGLSLLPAMVAPAPEGSLEIHVKGAQWWWRVEYLAPTEMPQVEETPVVVAEGTTRSAQSANSPAVSSINGPVSLANEIRLPVNRPVQFYLESEDVIHSFWIPALGGKVDMIPGRQTQLSLLPTRTGIFRGACAEYCGASHAWMNFYVIVMEQEDFDRWLESQSQIAREPTTELQSRGRKLFVSSGCGACHSVRGTTANGEIGPDLTHVGSRVSIGAGALFGEDAGRPAISDGDFQEWLRNPQRHKPSALMPRFDMLGRDNLKALAAYLRNLK